MARIGPLGSRLAFLTSKSAGFVGVAGGPPKRGRHTVRKNWDGAHIMGYKLLEFEHNENMK